MLGTLLSLPPYPLHGSPSVLLLIKPKSGWGWRGETLIIQLRTQRKTTCGRYCSLRVSKTQLRLAFWSNLWLYPSKGAASMRKDKLFSARRHSQTRNGHQQSGTPNCLVDRVAFPFGPCFSLTWNRFFSELHSRDEYKFDLVLRNVYLAKNMPASLYF